MLVRAFNPALLALVGMTATPLACSSASVESPAIDGGSDASVVDARPAPTPTPDAAVEGPSPVTEKPSPVCHDMEQRAEPVPVVPKASRTPGGNPLETLAPGFYTIVSKIEYGATEPIEDPPFRTTVYVSPTRFFVLIEGEGDSPQRVRVAATFDWSIRRGTLERTYLCASNGWDRRTSSQRIDASENGFTIYTPGQQTASGFIASRYVRIAD